MWGMGARGRRADTVDCGPAPGMPPPISPAARDTGVGAQTTNEEQRGNIYGLMVLLFEVETNSSALAPDTTYPGRACV